MPSIIITLSDTPTGGVSVHSDFKPAVGMPLSPAQSAALDIVARTGKQWGVPTGAAAQLAASQSVAETVAKAQNALKNFNAALQALPSMKERGR